MPETGTPGHPLLVLVHSPLVGASTWQPVAGVLRARGHAVLVPSLAEAFAGGAPYYPGLAGAVAEAWRSYGGDGAVVLVGHSGAGGLLPAIAGAMGAAVEAMVFVDALLPHPGRSWFETVPAEMREHLRGLAREGVVPPWDEWFPPGTVEELLPDPAVRGRFRAELPRLPLAYFGERAPARTAPPGRCAYLRLSDAYEAEARQAEGAGWPVERLDAHHLAPLTEPERIAAAIEGRCQWRVRG